MEIPESALQVFRPGGPPVPGERLVNFDPQVRVAIGSAFLANLHRTKITLAPFGFPGNGKTAFARFIASRLQQVGFYVAWLDCVRLTQLSAQEGGRLCSHLNLLLEETEQRPLLVVASGFDALDSAVAERPDLAGVMGALVEGVTMNGRRGRLLFLTTVVWPACLMKRFVPSWPVFVYFDWPSEVEAANYLRLLGIPKAADVVRHLFSRAAQQQAVYSNGSLIRGATHAWDAQPDLAAMGAQQIADAIGAFCPPVPREEREEYSRENRRFILEALAVAADWDRDFDDKVSSDYASLVERPNGKNPLRSLLRKLALRTTL